ncbi:GNAT family N-acetyltransferase [Streptomyces sp. NPDC046860]|uniref:GNAT family N-acetyltransferase n=1 Tax=Streptomyces sp. NPDC046860 TaxID=3154495 RepID=UPI0033F9AE46
MSLVRRAVPEDAREVLRLRQVMIDAVSGGDAGTWHEESLSGLRARLADPDGTFAAFVVDHPERPGALAALAAGTAEYRIGRESNPRGVVGFVCSVATDPGTRRRGYSRRCVDELLAWFRGRGARQIQLTASAEARPMYEALGFRPKPDPLMELRL